MRETIKENKIRVWGTIFTMVNMSIITEEDIENWVKGQEL